jgi:hypothetical protein
MTERDLREGRSGLQAPCIVLPTYAHCPLVAGAADADPAACAHLTQIARATNSAFAGPIHSLRRCNPQLLSLGDGRTLALYLTCAPQPLRLSSAARASRRHSAAASLLFSPLRSPLHYSAVGLACSDVGLMRMRGLLPAAALDGPRVGAPSQRSVSRGPPRLSVPGLNRGLRISARVQMSAAADPATDNGRDCCSGLSSRRSSLRDLCEWSPRPCADRQDTEPTSPVNHCVCDCDCV